MTVPTMTNRPHAARVSFDSGGLVRPGVETTLQFSLTDALNGRPVKPILSMEKEMHLIIVSRDLGYFSHVHPMSTGAVGQYEVKHTFPAAGDFILYDEFELPGVGEEVHPFNLKVGGGASPAAQLTEDMTPQKIGDYSVNIQPVEPVRAGVTSSFVVTVERGGEPVDDLQPYLGSAGHVILLNENASAFAHVHPVAGTTPPRIGMEGMRTAPAKFGPAFTFNHRFSQPGQYKVWAQFQHNGQVQTVSWVVEAR